MLKPARPWRSPTTTSRSADGEERSGWPRAFVGSLRGRRAVDLIAAARDTGGGGTSSSRSAASSTLGRSIDDDESSFYSTADLSCQNILSRLIRTRCGNLDDSASLCENSESEGEDQYYDESVASTLYSDHPKKSKDGRIVSFDDESDDRDARQQKILMLKQKKQMKEKPQVSDSVLERPPTAEESTRAVDEDIPEGRSIVSDAASKQESKFSKHGSVSTEGRPLDRLNQVATQLLCARSKVCQGVRQHRGGGREGVFMITVPLKK